MRLISILVLAFISTIACQFDDSHNQESNLDILPVAHIPSQAKTPNGQYISWKEHIIDDTQISGIEISGSDGLQMADLDKDGYDDIVSVHESDTEYDGELSGQIRIAFGSVDPDQWELVTLADGAMAAAAEDVTIADLNGDGYLDIVAACELAHLIYFENPTKSVRHSKWASVIPNITLNRGSFIRVFAVDLNHDGQPEIVAANKGDQANDGSVPVDKGLKPVSYFEIEGNPLIQESWKETELIQLNLPVNCQPIDIDQDGDMDIIVGSRGERRIVLLENNSTDSIQFRIHDIDISGSAIPEEEKLQLEKIGMPPFVTGFNMEFLDINKDHKLDILLAESFQYFTWLEQPEQWSDPWIPHSIGGTLPDFMVGLRLVDINDDGHPDLMTGGYSRGPRDTDEGVTVNDPLGRLAWFENPNDPTSSWTRHDISRRKRGMFDQFVAKDMDGDGDIDFVSTRGNSEPYDGVFWLEQIRSKNPRKSFQRARDADSKEMQLPSNDNTAN